MLLRFAAGVAFTVVACSSSDPTPGTGTSSSSSSSSSGEEPVDLSKSVNSSQCKSRCSKLLQDKCDEKSTDANKNCNSICRETGNGYQMQCLEDDIACDDLTHEKTLLELCPKTTP